MASEPVLLARVKLTMAADPAVEDADGEDLRLGADRPHAVNRISLFPASPRVLILPATSNNAQGHRAMPKATALYPSAGSGGLSSGRESWAPALVRCLPDARPREPLGHTAATGLAARGWLSRSCPPVRPLTARTTCMAGAPLTGLRRHLTC